MSEDEMWTIQDYSDGKRGGYIRIIDDRFTVCDIFPFAAVGGVGRDKALENARVIVNADQLHDALRQLVDHVIDGCPDDGHYAVTEAKAALAGIRPVPHSQP